MDYTHAENCTCPGCLTWDDFDHDYIDSAMEYTRQMLTYALSIELLSDFPKNLPQYLLIPIVANRHQVLRAEMRRRGIAPEPEHAADDAFFKRTASVELTQEQHRIRCAYEGLYHPARLGMKSGDTIPISRQSKAPKHG